ncbi:S-formylglutathione hydrolase FrmB [Amycolatopsis xylanica]|uniref:S-formylglutathione hydrolase FrmB n=2 Tax=Amycolatopsis xylanica TaxID=589385 RepID=A0A1H3MXV5_9PSEU|nr:S-formylglutathione hydrolase FrmB [Amycolatopsis xylanica]
MMPEVTGAGVEELRFFSPAVGREVGVTLLKPPGERPPGGYPVLLLLHGSSDDQRSWTAQTQIAELAAASKVLVAMPEGGRLGFYTDWRVPDRDGTIPRWESFHLGELLPMLETEYGASDARMVAGISMGGYGALRYGMRHPELFRAVASLSGIMHLTRPGMAALLGLLSVREGHRPGKIWGPRWSSRAVWAENDPLLHAEALASTRVYLAAGDGHKVAGEETVPGMGLIERYSRSMTEELAARLHVLNADVTTDFGAGTHFWQTWRGALERLWPYVVDTLR